MSATYAVVTFDPETRVVIDLARKEVFPASELSLANGHAQLINQMNRHTGSGMPAAVVPLVAPGTMRLGVEEVEDLSEVLGKHNYAMVNYLAGEADPALVLHAQEALARDFTPDILVELVRHYAAYQIKD